MTHVLRAWSIGLALSLAGIVCGCGSGQGDPQPAKPAPDTSKSKPEGVSSPAPEKPSRWKHQESLDRAVRYLLDTQRENGAWGQVGPRKPISGLYIGGVNTLLVWVNASSGLCCMAMLMQPSSDEIDAAVLKGYRYLIDAPDTPRTDMGTFYNVWSNAYVLQALARGMKDDRLKELHPAMKKRGEHELRRLLMHQSLDGGWGYFDFDERMLQPSGKGSVTVTTAAVMVALKDAREAGFSIRDDRVMSGVRNLSRIRFANGAYGYSSGHKYAPRSDANYIRGSLGRSQAGNNALYVWNHEVDLKDIDWGLQNFFAEHEFIEIGRQRQFPHEAWYATAPYYYYYGHFYASRNIALIEGEKRLDYAEELAELVAKTQGDEGCFWDYAMYGVTKAYGTGYGVMILSNCRRMLEE
ncbi:MAG: hypothetical protein OEY28_11770 [Nitrospira sp.]|nr:hypothetical protein [Nitrospira sp.]